MNFKWLNWKKEAVVIDGRNQDVLAGGAHAVIVRDLVIETDYAEKHWAIAKCELANGRTFTFKTRSPEFVRAVIEASGVCVGPAWVSSMEGLDFKRGDEFKPVSMVVEVSISRWSTPSYAWFKGGKIIGGGADA